MSDIHSELRRLLAEAKTRGRSLKSITEEAGVAYFRVRNFVSGRVTVIDARIAEKVHVVLTGKGFVR